jgi:hypothetical protein
LKAQGSALKAALTKADKDLANLPGLRTRKARLEAALEDAQRATADGATTAAKAAELAAALAREDWLPEVRSELADVNSRLDGCAGIPAEHARVRAEITRLAPFEAQQAHLVAAEQKLAQERDHLAHLEELEEGVGGVALALLGGGEAAAELLFLDAVVEAELLLLGETDTVFGVAAAAVAVHAGEDEFLGGVLGDVGDGDANATGELYFWSGVTAHGERLSTGAPEWSGPAQNCARRCNSRPDKRPGI